MKRRSFLATLFSLPFVPMVVKAKPEPLAVMHDGNWWRPFAPLKPEPRTWLGKKDPAWYEKMPDNTWQKMKDGPSAFGDDAVTLETYPQSLRSWHDDKYAGASFQASDGVEVVVPGGHAERVEFGWHVGADGARTIEYVGADGARTIEYGVINEDGVMWEVNPQDILSVEIRDIGAHRQQVNWFINGKLCRMFLL